MRAALIAALSCLLLAAPAIAQDPQFDNATPIDFTRPFIADPANFMRGSIEDSAIQTEVIGREELLRLGNPTMEELVRSLGEIGTVQQGGTRLLPPPQSELAAWCASQRGVLTLTVLRNCPAFAGRTLVTLNGRRLADPPPGTPGECILREGERVSEGRFKACGTEVYFKLRTPSQGPAPEVLP